MVAVASPRFAIAKARDFSFGETPPDARASKLDVDVAHAILQINDARRVALVDDTKVRRWDNVLVCGDCYEAYAELAQRRARWIAPHLVRRRKQLHDAALLCLEDSPRRSRPDAPVSRSPYVLNCVSSISYTFQGRNSLPVAGSFVITRRIT